MPVFDDYSDNIFIIRRFGKRGVTEGKMVWPEDLAVVAVDPVAVVAPAEQ